MGYIETDSGERFVRNKVPRSLKAIEVEEAFLPDELDPQKSVDAAVSVLYTDAPEFVRKAFNGRYTVKHIMVIYDDGYGACFTAEPRDTPTHIFEERGISSNGK